MGRRDLLPNAIYQRIKQLQSRLKKRAEDEEKRQEMAEKAVTARWEEHQKKMLQFENYLKSLECHPTKNIQRSTKSAPTRIERPVPPNSRMGSTPLHEAPTMRSISLEQVQLVETCISSSPSQFAESSPQAAELSNHGWSPTSPTDSKSDKNSTGKSNLAQALTELESKSADKDKSSLSSSTSSGKQSPLSNDAAEYSRTFSPPPSLPSTPSLSATPFQQTPLPGPETPVESGPATVSSPDIPPQRDVPNISVTKMATASLGSNSSKEVASPKKLKQKPKKKNPKPLKKKLNRTRPEKPPRVVETPPEQEDEVATSKSKDEAKKEIKTIFENVNALPEEELTEEAFDVFLDTIKQLSEYVDHNEVDSQKYEVIDDFWSDFSYESYIRDHSGVSLTPDKMFGATPSPCISRNSTCSTPGAKSKVEKGQKVARMTRQQTRDRRKQRMLVVREKQNDIITYRKVTLAELRLRRQRALMRARAKIVENARERDEIEMQRVRLLELANMNEQQRLERQAQFKREEEERIRLEEEQKRLKEERVKEELNQLMEQSKKRLEEEERFARENRDLEENDPLEEEEVLTSTEEDTDQSVNEREIAQTWRSVAKRARNRDVFENMIKQNSVNLYKTLVKELIIEKQKSTITDIPGFSYFLLLKYTMDLDDIADIMLEL